MISGVGASQNMRYALEPVEDFAINSSATYAKPLVSGSGGFKITDQAAGRVAFDLNDGYSMWIDESKSAFTVANGGKETVHVWGAAQVALDGTTLGGFAGTTSLVLGNGTKISMETLPDTKTSTQFYLDRLTVTQGECAVVVSGVSQMIGGDLTITQSHTGEAIDDRTRDGLVFEQVAPSPPPPPTEPAQPETNTLIGWADEYGVAVTPEMLAATLPGGAFGPGSQRMSFQEFQTLIMRFLSWGQISSLMSFTSRSLSSDLSRHEPADVARAADLRRAWARHADEAAAATRSAIRSAEVRTLELSG
jgi:Domain of Unknown Function (DUF1521)